MRAPCIASLCIPLTVLLLGCSGGPGVAGGERPAANGEHAHTHSEAAERSARFAPLDLPTPSSTRLASGAPGPDYWQQRADYTIDATLDPVARTVAARSILTYTNNSPHDLDTLWVHLEQNLFRPDSDGTILAGPSDRFGNRTRFPGGFTVNAVALDSPSGRALTLAEFGTIGRIDLPDPIPARGGQVRLAFDFSFPIPVYGDDRMGILETSDGDVYQLAQWFPAACVYDDVRGWNTLPYLGQGEFYTNFGDYTVSVTVPADFVVGSTGTLQNAGEVLTDAERSRLSAAATVAEPMLIVNGSDARPSGGARTWRFRADNTRTFAWAASPAFIWDACTIPASGGAASVDVLVQSMYPKSAASRWGLSGKDGGSTRMLRDSILHYGRKWFPYPYPGAINVAGAVGGMEYPGIIFCSHEADDRGLFGVTTHEIGHTWFPMIVNSDERRNAWMDEGFNTFMNHYATQERYSAADNGDGGYARAGRREPSAQPIATAPDLLVPGTLGRTQYGLPAQGLILLREAVLGPERFDHAFRQYIRLWAFKSPQPSDFYRCMEDGAGMDLAWFWRGWFLSTGTLDQAVTAVVQPDGESRSARVTFASRAELIMPVLYRVTYTDGTTEDRRIPPQAWATQGTFTEWWDTNARKIARIEVDPDNLMPDTNRANNTWGR